MIDFNQLAGIEDGLDKLRDLIAQARQKLIALGAR
jgi:hypothetical protein